MSNRRNQRLPEEIYVRRRIAAAVTILVLVALVIWGLVAFAGGESDEGETTPETTTSAEASAASDSSEATAAAAQETGEPEASEAAAASSATETTGTSESAASSEATEATEATGTTGTSTRAAEPKDSCELRDLQITATSDRPSYGSNAQPTFYMTVDNPTAGDCEVDLDEDALRFEVYDLASNRRMWADTDCYPSVETGTRTFPAGEERHFEAVWSRTTSQPGQCSNRQPVPAGGYFLHAVIGDNPSDAHTFNLG